MTRIIASAKSFTLNDWLGWGNCCTGSGFKDFDGYMGILCWWEMSIGAAFYCKVTDTGFLDWFKTVAVENGFWWKKLVPPLENDDTGGLILVFGSCCACTWETDWATISMAGISNMISFLRGSLPLDNNFDEGSEFDDVYSERAQFDSEFWTVHLRQNLCCLYLQRDFDCLCSDSLKCECLCLDLASYCCLRSLIGSAVVQSYFICCHLSSDLLFHPGQKDG